MAAHCSGSDATSLYAGYEARSRYATALELVGHRALASRPGADAVLDPEAVRGRDGAIQRRSVESWVALGVQVRASRGRGRCRRCGPRAGRRARHRPRADRPRHAAARLGLRRSSTRVARFPLRCFVNADIILGADLLDAAHAVSRAGTAISHGRRDEEDGKRARRCRARLVRLPGRAVRRTAAVCHRPGVLRQLAGLEGAAGRHRRRRDARRARDPPAARLRRTSTGGMDEAYYGEEAARNLELAGGKEPHLHAPRREPRPPRRRSCGATPARPCAGVRTLRKLAWKLRRQMRVAFVSPEPTPYRAPLLDRVAALPEIDLTVIYAAQTVASRAAGGRHRPRGGLPQRRQRAGRARACFRHDYPITLGIFGALADAQPDVVVVSGWSTFASQASIAWCRLRRVPYVLLVESHDAGPKAGWRHQVKTTVVPPIVRGASSVLVVGTLARESVVALGADPARVRVFANTIDVAAWIGRADTLAKRRSELRAALGLGEDDVAVLSVARLAPEKGLDVLLRATAEAAVRRRARRLGTRSRVPREHRSRTRSSRASFPPIASPRHTSRPTSSRCCLRTSPGASSSTRRRRRAAARALGSRRRCRRPPRASARTACSCPTVTSSAAAEALTRLAGDPDAAPLLRRPLPRAGVVVGLRAVGRELRRGLPRGDRLPVDLLLVRRHVLPGHPPCRRDAAGRERPA